MIAQTTHTHKPQPQTQKDYDMQQVGAHVWMGEIFDRVTGQTLLTLRGRTEASVGIACVVLCDNPAIR